MFCVKFFSTLLAFGSAVQAITGAHPCAKFPTKVAKLRACATASSYCSSYIGGTASFTRTSTSTTTVEPASTTVTSFSTTTTTVYSAVETDSAPDSTVFTDTTTTSTITALTCDPTLKRRSPAALVAATRTSSCGLTANAVPSEVSGACNCILASTTTVVVTSTSGGVTTTATATTLVTVIDTVTTESTTTTTGTVTSITTTITAYSCTTPPPLPTTAFKILVDTTGTPYDGLYVYVPDGAGCNNFTSLLEEAGTFSFDSNTGFLYNAANSVQAAETDGGPNDEEHYYTTIYFGDEGPLPLFYPTCTIDLISFALECTGPYGSTAYGCNGFPCNFGWALGPANRSDPIVGVSGLQNCPQIALQVVF